MILFRSIRSGSSGNLLLLEHRSGRQRTRLLIDCGLASQRACHRILEEEVGLSARPDAVVVTHAHGDHINYSALRVLSQLQIPVLAHRLTRREILQRHLNPYTLPASVTPDEIPLRVFGHEPFEVGAFTLTPIALPHAPGVTTHGYLITQGHTRLLVASDFHDPEALAPHAIDCDFIYVESNHDAELLRLNFNPASLFHLPNHAAGLMLAHAFGESRRLPRTVVLGHLSEERNRPGIAQATVAELLRSSGAPGAVTLMTAPRHAPSETIVVRE
jgi:phosphoribosyl 1,2-cyclic phosphodiesterase